MQSFGDVVVRQAGATQCDWSGGRQSGDASESELKITIVPARGDGWSQIADPASGICGTGEDGVSSCDRTRLTDQYAFTATMRGIAVVGGDGGARAADALALALTKLIDSDGVPSTDWKADIGASNGKNICEPSS